MVRTLSILALACLCSVAGARALPPAVEALDLSLPPLDYPEYAAQDPDLRTRMDLLHGRYRLALARMGAAPDDDLSNSRALALAALGQREAALGLLTPDRVRAAGDPRLAHPRDLRLRLLEELGSADEALAEAAGWVEDEPDSVLARFAHGWMLERTGRLDEALAAWAWFADGGFLEAWQAQDGAQERGSPDHPDLRVAARLVRVARGLDRWATLGDAYLADRSLHEKILSMLVGAYDVVDREYWPARVEAARYFILHDNAHAAKEELAAALKANPYDRDALRLMADLAVESFNFDAADAIAATLRRLDPRSIDADLVAARNLLGQRRFASAEAPLRRILARRPNDIEALSLQASVDALLLREESMRAGLARIDALDEGNATSWFEVGRQLAAMRQYPRAEAMLREAVRRAPWWTAPRNELGLLYTQSGEEDKARAALEEAHARDPFNLRTTNYLRLLDDLEAFARHESPHFVILYDRAADPVVGQVFADYLESVHEELCALFGHAPSVPTYIEVFPTHDAFSVRTTGSPWIGTVGASTGRVIALVAPRPGGGTQGTFHWAGVLRHEYVHTITLSATENRIPHWMTEGLAVYAEKTPLRWEWAPLLQSAVAEGGLFPIEELTFAFIRPKRPGDRALAYAQSYWVCRFIEQRDGFDALLRLMERFREGRTEEQALADVLGLSVPQFNEAFGAWAADQVAGWGYDEATTTRYRSLREEGEALIRDKRFAEALQVWRQIETLRPMDPLPKQRLAGLYLAPHVNRPADAVAPLAALHAAETRDARYARRLSRLLEDLGRLDEAIAYARQTVYIEPGSASGQRRLLDLLRRAGDVEGAARQERVLALLDGAGSD